MNYGDLVYVSKFFITFGTAHLNNMTKHQKQHRMTVLTMLFILTLIFCSGMVYRQHQIAWTVMALEAGQSAQLKQDKGELQGENEALKEKLERSATYQTPEDVKKLSQYYIEKYFGKDAARVEVVMNCESGLDPRRVHINKDKSTDSGLYQIHDEATHRKNIEKMYGMPFELAVYDLDVSSKYAKFLWDRSPNNWVCNRLK